MKNILFSDEILERMEFVKDNGRHEKDGVIAVNEYKVVESEENNVADANIEGRKQ